MGFVEVKRDEEVGLVKNDPDSTIDNALTARRAVSGLHKKWLQEKGIIFKPKRDSKKG